MKRTIDTESGAFFPQPPALPHQEPERHEAGGHVVVPASPSAHLVVIEAHLALGVLESLLDQVPPRGRPDELFERRVPRRVGHEQPPFLATESLYGEERLLLGLSVAAGLDADRQRHPLDGLLLSVPNCEPPPFVDVAPPEEVGDPVPRRRSACLRTTIVDGTSST